jgi:hypothetical protein
LRDGPAAKVKVKVSIDDLGSQYIATMLTCWSWARKLVVRFVPKDDPVRWGSSSPPRR